MINLFQYAFIVRGMEVGLMIGAIAPLVGVFLVLRRYSLIADTLAHVSLAGVAIGLLLGWNPLATAAGVAVISSIGIERLRLSQKVYGDTALSIFLSGSLAVALILISVAHGFSVDLLSYLFGSIVTVKTSDVLLISILGAAVALAVILLFKELVFITFDEETARVSGIPTRAINIALIVLAALTVALAIPIVGVLLISALMVIPVVTAQQMHKGFLPTIIIAELVSLIAVALGIIGSFYLNIPASGAIVAILVIVFLAVFGYKNIE
ncbi:MAG: metal ABC transporter permease [Patescibacteria group bacterium]|nr:metal ABC transporter permease [Patescibacteria group bacterium]